MEHLVLTGKMEGRRGTLRSSLIRRTTTNVINNTLEGWPSGLERWLALASGQLCFGTLAIPFTPLCQCHSEETLKAVGASYLVSMPGEVKDPTSPHWNVQLSWTPPPTLNYPTSRVRLCGGKSCPALVSEEEHQLHQTYIRLKSVAYHDSVASQDSVAYHDSQLPEQAGHLKKRKKLRYSPKYVLCFYSHSFWKKGALC